MMFCVRFETCHRCCSLCEGRNFFHDAIEFPCIPSESAEAFDSGLGVCLGWSDVSAAGVEVEDADAPCVSCGGGGTSSTGNGLVGGISGIVSEILPSGALGGSEADAGAGADTETASTWPFCLVVCAESESTGVLFSCPGGGGMRMASEGLSLALDRQLMREELHDRHCCCPVALACPTIL